MTEEYELSKATASAGDLDQRVRRAAFQAIYDGDTPSSAQLAARLDAPAVEVESAVQRVLDRGMMTADDDGQITGSHGLSLSPTDHRLTFALGDRYVWCAVDAVGIPAAMAVDAEVTSRCFLCSEPVSLRIKGGAPQGPDADALRIGIGTAGSSGKVNEDLCPMINFFCSQEHAEAWAASAGRANLISIGQAAEIGRRQWADVI